MANIIVFHHNVTIMVRRRPISVADVVSCRSSEHVCNHVWSIEQQSHHHSRPRPAPILPYDIPFDGDGLDCMSESRTFDRSYVTRSFSLPNWGRCDIDDRSEHPCSNRNSTLDLINCIVVPSICTSIDLQFAVSPYSQHGGPYSVLPWHSADIVPLLHR